MATKKNKPGMITTAEERAPKKQIPVDTKETAETVLRVPTPVAVKVLFLYFDGQQHEGEEHPRPFATEATPADVKFATAELKKLVKPRPERDEANGRPQKLDIRHFFGSDEVMQAWRDKRWENAGTVYDLIHGLERAKFDTESNRVKTVAEMDAVANEVRERNAKIKELEARRPDSGEDAPIPCGSALHRGDNPPIQPMERNAVNHKTLEVVLHKEGAKKGKVKVLGDFTVVPAEDGGLAKVFHCDVCRAKLNAAAGKNNLRQPWYNSMGAEKVLYFEEHRDQFQARSADSELDDLAERMVLGGIARPFRASIGERVGGGQRRQR